MLASTLALLLSLTATPKVLNSLSPGSAPPRAAGLGYVATAADWVYPVGTPRSAPALNPGNANGYWITQIFNNSCDPARGQGYYEAGQYFCGHTGVDLFDGQAGGEVRATANGLVVYAAANASYGNMVRIQHLLPDGSYVYSQYEHLMVGSLVVVPGQVVAMGQPIGRVGDSGFATGPHLHFEIKSLNDDGVGYTFGNAALLYGYFEPLSFVAAHAQWVMPTSTPTLRPPTAPAAVSATVPRTKGSMGGEQHAVLAAFYKRYHAFVVVTADHLNVRAGSGFRFAPLNSVTRGARLAYLGMTGDGWIHVALPSDIFGYVARQWVRGTMLPQLPPVAMSSKLKPPFWAAGGTLQNPLGTDQLGRDVLSRMLYGLQVSLLVAVLAVLVSGALGVALGLLAGFYGGRAEAAIMRLVDVQLSMPVTLVAIAVIAAVGTNLTNLILVLGVTQWPLYARVVRGEALAIRGREFLLAARAVGASAPRMIVLHVLPNTYSSIVVVATLGVASVVVFEAGLSFLGLGVQPPQPSLGSMLSEGREYLATAWWLGVFPGLAIMLLVLAINLLGDGLRDVLDPRRQL